MADVVFGFFVFSAHTGFRPPLPQYAFFVLVTAAFIILARRLPHDWARRGMKPMRRPRFYFTLSIVGALTCLAIFWILPNTLSFPFAPALVVLFGGVTVIVLIRFLAGFDWWRSRPMHRFGITAGVITLFAVSTVFQEMDKNRPDNTSGMALVGLTFLIGLALLWWRLKRAESLSETSFDDKVEGSISG